MDGFDNNKASSYSRPAIGPTSRPGAAAARPLRPPFSDALARTARLSLACAPAAVADDNGTGLTVREVEVLALLAEGLTNRQIASRLFISQKTVGAHMSAGVPPSSGCTPASRPPVAPGNWASSP